MAEVVRVNGPAVDTGIRTQTITLPFDAAPGDYLRRDPHGVYERCAEKDADVMLMQFANADEPVTVVTVGIAGGLP